MNERFVYLREVSKSEVGSVPYPLYLFISLDAIDHFICIGEGLGHGSMGGSLTPSEFISGKWDDYISIFQAEWLVDLIKSVGPYKVSAQQIVDRWKGDAHVV